MEWKTSNTLVDYPEALREMEARVEDILAGRAPELVWLLEHPPLYTSGTSAKGNDLLDARRFPTYQAGRGGEWTYHGPGQRVAYVMLDLKKRAAPDAPDLRAYVGQLEQWIIGTLKGFGIEGFTREGRVGVWVKDSGSEKTAPLNPVQSLEPESKIAAIGVRVRKWVTYHGICINVHPDLRHYQGIVPCGISGYGVTSFAALGKDVPLSAFDEALKAEFSTAF